MNINGMIITLLDKILPYIFAGAIIVTFIAIVMTGFEIILNRKDEDKRKEALKSLIFVAVGTIFIVGSVFLTNVILKVATDVTNTMQTGEATMTQQK